ncbi:hypothetical protein ACA910_007038 [Epithemia clementina (nom. ined.)]
MPVAKPTPETATLSCRGVFQVAQQRTGPALEADGTEVALSGATRHQGVRVAYVGPLYNDYHGYEVAYNAQSCERLDDGHYWQCEGAYVDLYGCTGELTFLGIHQGKYSTGHYVITGGTDDFLGATGYIEEAYHGEGWYIRQVHIS